MKFDIKNYENLYCVMHCPTEESAKVFCAYMHSLGRTWKTGQSYLEETYWPVYENDTHYIFEENRYAAGKFCMGHNYAILDSS